MHRVAVSLHTLSLICIPMQHPGHCLTHLCIPVRCRECPHTERSRSSQGVPVVPSLLRCPGDLEDPERQWSQKDPGVLFVTLLVALQLGGGTQLVGLSRTTAQTRCCLYVAAYCEQNLGCRNGHRGLTSQEKEKCGGRDEIPPLNPSHLACLDSKNPEWESRRPHTPCLPPSLSLTLK